MVLLAKILSPVLGVTSEAIHATCDRSSSRKQATSSPPESSSTDNAKLDTENDRAQSDVTINRTDEKHASGTVEAERSPDFDYVNGFDQDEAVWELDEIADSVREPKHADTATEVRRRQAQQKGSIGS